MTTITVDKGTAQELRSHLSRELAMYREVAAKFSKKYRTSLSKLEEKIRKKGVHPDKHELWEDSIEWRNAIEETRKLEAMFSEIFHG